jgi:hypothetical protein
MKAVYVAIGMPSDKTELMFADETSSDEFCNF